MLSNPTDVALRRQQITVSGLEPHLSGAEDAKSAPTIAPTLSISRKERDELSR